MNNEITESLLMTVAGDVEKLLPESTEKIAFAFGKHAEEGIKLSLGITLDHSPKGICVNYDLGFDLEPKPQPPEKCKVKFKHTIAEDQGEIFDEVGNQ